MRKIILFMHVSLDGFVAGPNGEMDWIRVDDQIFDYAAKFTDQADTALYGRVTYQMMEGYWPTAGDQPNASAHDLHHSRWYNRVAKVVVSNSLQGSDIPNTQIVGDHLVEQIQQLKQKPGKNICIFGSPTASHSLMQHGLIDEYWLFLNPVLLGAGILLFQNIHEQVNLRLAASNTFPSGVIGLHYERK